MVTLTKFSTDYSQHARDLEVALKNLKTRVEALVRTYAKTFRVDFQLDPEMSLTPGEPRLSTSVQETLLVRVCCVHRLPPDFSHTDYRVDLRVYHGTRLVGGHTLATATKPATREQQDLHKAVWLDHWLEVAALPLSQVPLEARLVLSLVGRTQEQEQGTFKVEELGFAAVQLFNHEGFLAQGAFLLPVWPVEACQQVGPAPDSGSHPSGTSCPLISLELPELGGPVSFPSCNELQEGGGLKELDQLDSNTQQQLKDICEQDILEFTKRSPSERELLWDKRHYLGSVPGALPKVLQLHFGNLDPMSS